jgi:hypothetical protein
VDFVTGTHRSRPGVSSATARGNVVHEQKLPAVRSSRLAAGTLACSRCDAPVALGAEAVSLCDQLVCPYCHTRAPSREFLSLALPTRAAHVVVRVSYRQVGAGRT